jgi:hypothetical protein
MPKTRATSPMRLAENLALITKPPKEKHVHVVGKQKQDRPDRSPPRKVMLPLIPYIPHKDEDSVA